MEILVISPELIMPWEHKYFDERLFYKAIGEKYMERPLEERIANASAAFQELQEIDYLKYRKKYNDRCDEGWKHVPPVPVVEAPNDLLHLGFFIVYNGHTRLEAARRAGMPLPVMLLENDEDIIALKTHHDNLFFVPEKGAFQRHRGGVWDYAYCYLKRLVIA